MLTRHDRTDDPVDRLGTHDLIAGVERTSPDFARLLVDHALEGVLERPGVSVATHELLAVALLAAQGADAGQLRVHGSAALDAGAEPGALVDTLMQVATFAGYPRALVALEVVSALLDERRVPLPVARTTRATAEAFLAALRAGDVEALLGLLHPEVEWVVPGGPELLPWAGRRHGRDAVRAFYETLAAEATPERLELGPPAVAAGVAFVPGTFAYRFPRTGGSYAGTFVMALTVVGGQVLRYEMHEDSHGLATAYRNA